ncbi:MAG: ABC-three component system protein, partial [Candidatus Acidiferrales bacterium]
SKPCGVPPDSIYLCGVEQLEIWMKTFPDVPKLAALDLVDSPLIISPDDLAEIIQALARNKEQVRAAFDDPPTPRVPYEYKNKLNYMTKEYATAQRRLYLKETPQIHAFLAAPENVELLSMYESVVDEFELKIIAKRKAYQTFDEVMEYLIDLLFGRDVVLRQHAHKRLTRAVLFYMYWNCDIGENGDGEAN